MQEPYTGAGTPFQSSSPQITGSTVKRILLPFILPVLMIVLLAGSLSWLQWASLYSFTLGYPAPHVSITTSPSSVVVAGNSAQFSASASGRDVTYSWDFGDQSYGYGATVSHTYQSGGTFTVTVTAIDAIGQSNSDSINVNISNPAPPPPTAQFTYNQSSYGYNVSFDASSSTAYANLQISTYSWNFGDGSTDPNVSYYQDSHTYNGPGNYQVTLTVTDSSGQTSQPYTTTVTVQ